MTSRATTMRSSSTGKSRAGPRTGPLRLQTFDLGPAHRLLLTQQPQHLIDAHHATSSRPPDYTRQIIHYRNKPPPQVDTKSVASPTRSSLAAL